MLARRSSTFLHYIHDKYLLSGVLMCAVVPHCIPLLDKACKHIACIAKHQLHINISCCFVDWIQVSSRVAKIGRDLHSTHEWHTLHCASNLMLCCLTALPTFRNCRLGNVVSSS